MLHANYIAAIEKRLAWLRWIRGHGHAEFYRNGFGKIVDTYEDVLATGDTFFMSEPFCTLVDHARREMPGDIAFDARWLQSKRGWLYLQVPFEVPESQTVVDTYPEEYRAWLRQNPVRMMAVGWREIPEGALLHNLGGAPPEPARPGSVQFCYFTDLAAPDQPWPWAYFVARDGDRMDERAAAFEQKARESGDPGAMYVPYQDRMVHPLHEIRWLYAALHLMAQRLATTVQHTTDRHTRRRAERQGQAAPPFIRVVTLRRLEQDRRRDPKGSDVDWQWQWTVRGHWRQQFYPSEGVHKPVFVEA